MHCKNTAQESFGKTITDSHQQPSEETDDTVEDTTYKMPPLGHVNESDSDDEVLVKRIKKKKRRNKVQAKENATEGKKSQPEKKEDVKKSPKPPIQIAQLSVTKHKKEHKSLKKKQHVQKSAAVPVKGPKSVQSVPKPVTELPGDLCKWLVDKFDPYSVTLYISPDKRIKITPMDVHITLALPIGGKKVEEFYGKKA
ncbi:hypothetical protein Cgig2_016472 [Carnegiea gigantea]|uniref:Uncharacterized protein n=1 Tax=Carnegiea gigantea TaxID=171969 RepID=A0A9Q1KNK3_9CARY|nr:hypothetical protein Cgig2_016472 [Carnegiea gigantea]